MPARARFGVGVAGLAQPTTEDRIVSADKVESLRVAPVVGVAGVRAFEVSLRMVLGVEKAPGALGQSLGGVMVLILAIVYEVWLYCGRRLRLVMCVDGRTISNAGGSGRGMQQNVMV